MKKEIWKQIKGFEGYYSISDHGRVRNDKYNTILKGSIRNGFIYYSLTSPNNTKTLHSHKLFTDNFITPKNNK